MTRDFVIAEPSIRLVTRPRSTASGLAGITLTDAAIVTALAGAPRSKNWCLRPMIVTFCFLPPFIVIVLSLFQSDLTNPAWPAQCALGVSTFCSLLLLGDRPLINPVQAFVLVFHFWFSWGPATIALFASLGGDFASAAPYLGDHQGGLWVVAFGLPLFAACASLTLRVAREARVGLRFLLPSGVLYSSRTLFSYAAVGAAVYLVLLVLSRFGLSAFQNADYLGGQVTVSPALAALSAILRLGQFATVGLLGYLVLGSRKGVRSMRPLIILIVLLNMGLALQSGSKGLIVLPLFYISLVFFTFKQRLPWGILISLFALYLLFVEPFVASSRQLALKAGLETPEERAALFWDQLKNMNAETPDVRDINVESPFRGIYDRTNEVSARSSLLDGPWKGQSLRDGYSAVVPRFLDPNKADSNMGNFFAHELGVSSSEDEMNNIAITIPFEIVGNYGFIPGILSFGVLGILWTLFVCFLLSESRLATHPLTPLCVTMLLAIESSVGQFVNGLKDLPIALVAAWLVWLFLGRQKKNV